MSDTIYFKDLKIVKEKIYNTFTTLFHLIYNENTSILVSVLNSLYECWRTNYCKLVVYVLKMFLCKNQANLENP